MIRKKKKTVLDDCFTPKKTTICIFDEGDKIFRSYPLNISDFNLDKFLVNVDGKIYVLQYEIEHLKSYRSKTAPVVDMLFYFRTSDQLHLDLSDLRMKHPEISNIIHRLFVNEKRQVVTLNDILDTYPEKDHELERSVTMSRWNSIEFVDGLTMSPIETSSDRISEQIHSNPQSIASILTSVKNTDQEWRRISNPIQKGFDKWWLLIAIIGIIAVAGIVGYAAMEPDVSQQDLFNAISRLDQANQTVPDLTPAQDLFVQQVPSQDTIEDQDSSFETSVFESVNELVNESLGQPILTAPDVRSVSPSFEHSWQECRIIDGVQECHGILDPRQVDGE